jgi:hypothetical protein
MARNTHISPREETEHDTTVFMRVVILTGLAFLLIFIVALLILYGTNGKMIPKANPPHQASQTIFHAANSLTC